MDAYLYNLRHPIDRLLAWYIYERPSSCVSNEETLHACEAAQAVAKHPNGYTWQFFVDCFSSQDYLSLAFISKTSQGCNQLFSKVLANDVHASGFRETPFKYDLRYYTNKMINQYTNKTVPVLRSQNMFKDLHDLEVFMDGNGTFPRKETFHDLVPSDELTRYYGQVCWKGTMHEELYEYRRLIPRAANFNERTKRSTINGAANDRCGFSSWKVMERIMMKKQPQQQMRMVCDNVSS